MFLLQAESPNFHEVYRDLLSLLPDIISFAARKCESSTLFKIILAMLVPLYFEINVRIDVSISPLPSETLIMITLNSQITLGEWTSE